MANYLALVPLCRPCTPLHLHKWPSHSDDKLMWLNCNLADDVLSLIKGVKGPPGPPGRPGPTGTAVCYPDIVI